MLNVNQTAEILKHLNDAKRSILMTHANPDGDALGSTLGLAALLKKKFPTGETLCVCHDPAPPSFRFLPGVSSLQQDFQETRGDLMFFLDTAEPKLTDFEKSHPRIFQPGNATQDGIATIKIDHHPAEQRPAMRSTETPPSLDFAHLNLVDPQASSSSEIVVDIADSLDLTITEETATCLLTGIFTDTGSFMHSNTSSRVYHIASRLLRRGADQRAIVKNIFRTSKLSTLRLWGRVLEKITLIEEGGAISAVTAGDFRATGADFSELTGAVDYLNSIPGMKFSLILSERGGKVKGSLRTLQDDIDVAAMAQRFSGGGHKKAAGFSINGSLEEERRWKVIPPAAGN